MQKITSIQPRFEDILGTTVGLCYESQKRASQTCVRGAPNKETRVNVQQVGGSK